MGDGTVVNPSKVNLDLGESAAYPPYHGFMNAMPAYVGFADVAGLKWAGGNLGERKKRNIPYCSSLIMLVNPHINNFISVLDGALITNMRTGAQTAVALKYLFNHGSSQRRPIRLGIYGAGMQGHMQTRPSPPCSTLRSCASMTCPAPPWSASRRTCRTWSPARSSCATTPARPPRGRGDLRHPV